ncbi:MAG: phosphoribosylaminoimidazolesuccinocarboxamide synthase [Treponema sp.]|nr:phosphoribosylaminoimidazolesuccinocarboxamide synthase [Treponema sp.]
MNELLYEGKSKIIFSGPDADTYVIRFKDTATAFNGEKKEELKGKGRLNAAISNLIYEYLAKNGIKTHLLKELDETSILVMKAEIVMVELIVRNLAAGSFSKKYGVAEGTELKNTVVEFSLKSDSLGDPMINASQITAIGLASKEDLDEMIRHAHRINELLTALFFKAGIKLIDFKIEFGKLSTNNGDEIIVCDEISPDSCRLWDAVSNEKMDKDRFRRDLGGVLDGYRKVLERLKKAIQGG